MSMAAPIARGADDAADNPDTDKLIPVDIKLLNGTMHKGKLLNVTETDVHVLVDDAPRTFAIADIHPWSLYWVRRMAIARNNPRVFVEFGRIYLEHEDPEEADEWFDRALAVDETMDALVSQARQDPAAPIDVNPDAEVEGKKYRETDPAVEAAGTELADGWHKLILDRISKKCERIETPHFIIYSTYKKQDNKTLPRILEKLYAALCRQFTVPRGQNIWSPKLPIFAFWRKSEYGTFIMEGMTSPNRARLLNAGGLCGSQMGLTYVILNEVNLEGASQAEAVKWFCEVLVHETTHAFNSRYLSDIRLPMWFDEGIAEYMAAELVPGCRADKWWRSATRYVRTGRVDVRDNLERFGGSYLDYATMQSLVRYMMARKGKQFVKFYELLKAGKSQSDALKEAYGWDEDELIDRWLRSAKGI